MRWSKYNTTWLVEKDLYVFNSIHNSLIVTEKNTDFSDPSHVDELLKQGFVVDDATQEEELAYKSITKKLNTSDTFSCWIFVTNDCNLSCSYCFEKESLLNKEVEYMDKNLCSDIVNWILKKAKEMKVQNIHVTLTGGEPLINIDAITMVANLLSNTEFNVTYDVITNGVLLGLEQVQRLCEVGIRSYQITLDGPSSIHDMRRCYKDGEGTFDIIIRNIINALRFDDNILFVIRINVDEDNCNYVSQLLKLLKRLKLDSFIVICFGDTIKDTDKDKTEILRKNIELISLAESYGFEIAYGELNNCWMMSDYWYMINVDGSLYKCPSLVGMEQYSVGHIKGGITKNKLTKQMELKPWEDCINCELVGLCCGGCPYRDILSSRNEGKYKVCRKAYLQELLKLKYTKK